MGQFKKQMQDGCRAALRPVARMVRRLLTPTEPPVEFGWKTIEAGPAAGANVMVPLNTPIADAITTGSYDQKVLQVVEALVSKTDTCFDIGGHYGCYTLSLAKLVKDGKIHTFEPVRRTLRIRQATQKSKLNHVQVHQVSGWSEWGDDPAAQKLREVMTPWLFLMRTVVDTQAAHEHYRNFSRTTVNAVTLDSLLGTVPSVQFMK